jgi:hypothetical protein
MFYVCVRARVCMHLLFVCFFLRVSACFCYVRKYLYFCAGLFVSLCPYTSSHSIPDLFNTNDFVLRFRPLNLP